ncbi:hypothetical protein BGX24_012581 [Mortierella sp. AD032]|nr:hypothetical protein BGX24_012581 [Mortierella sp. AD032]
MTLAYSPNDQQLAFGTGGGTIYLWDLQSEEPGAKLEGHKDWIRSIAYSPCGQWIASGSRDWTVIIWRRQQLEEEESWARVYSIHAFFATVESVSWNPVVPLELVTGSQDGSVRVWRVLCGDGDEDGEPGSVEVKLIWGSNLGILCADGLELENATGLNSFDRNLLTQRGAVGLKIVEEVGGEGDGLEEREE